MLVICQNNDGFEDQLTQGTEYRALEVRGASVLLRDDQCTERWFGLCKFRLVIG